MARTLQVLIADDARFQREMVRHAVRMVVPDAVITEADNGLDALGKATARPFDLVMLDLEMPHMNGADVLYRIKMDRPDTVVGLVTSNEDEQVRQSVISLGADFFIQKPFTTGDIRAAVEQALVAAIRLGSKRDARVLVADDSRTIREVMAATLRLMGLRHTLEEVADGRAALDAFKRNRHDLLFLDVNMPGLTGLEALARIRALAPNVFAVLVTSDSDRDTLVAARTLAVDGFILKPVTSERLGQVVDRFKKRWADLPG